MKFDTTIIWDSGIEGNFSDTRIYTFLWDDAPYDLQWSENYFDFVSDTIHENNTGVHKIVFSPPIHLSNIHTTEDNELYVALEDVDTTINDYSKISVFWRIPLYGYDGPILTDYDDLNNGGIVEVEVERIQ